MQINLFNTVFVSRCSLDYATHIAVWWILIIDTNDVHLLINIKIVFSPVDWCCRSFITFMFIYLVQNILTFRLFRVVQQCTSDSSGECPAMYFCDTAIGFCGYCGNICPSSMFYPSDASHECTSKCQGNMYTSGWNINVNIMFIIVLQT